MTLRTMSFRQKMNTFITAMLAIVILVILFAVAGMYLCVRDVNRVMRASYVQSSLSDVYSRIDQAMERYGADPSRENSEQVLVLFSKFERGFEELNTEPSVIGTESAALVHAAGNAYRNYREQARALFASDDGAHGHPFYIAFYQTTEIGQYLDGYLSRMIRSTLAQSTAAYETQQSNLRTLLFVAGALVLSILTLAAALSNLASKQFIQPVQELSQATHALVGNNMDIPDIPVRNEDEIGELVRTFNRMKQDCRRLIVTMQENDELARRLYEEELKRINMENSIKSMRYSLLKQQMNPHFLFNTLNLISHAAQQEQTEELIGRLSALLRYNLYTTADQVPVSSELSVLHSYFYIQEVRFGDRYGFLIDCRVDPEAYLIPAFTLQPLVENAVKHGIAPRASGGKVRVKIIERGGALVISVTDNGAGMPRAILNALRRGANPGDDTRIGIRNVESRLHILYPDASFDLCSLQSLGTCIRITIPHAAAAEFE